MLVAVGLGRAQLLKRNGGRELLEVRVVVVAVWAKHRSRSGGIRTRVVSAWWGPLQQEVDVVELRGGRALLQSVVRRLGQRAAQPLPWP